MGLILQVLGRPGFSIADKKRRTGNIGAKHRIGKEEAMRWFQQKVKALGLCPRGILASGREMPCRKAGTSRWAGGDPGHCCSAMDFGCSVVAEAAFEHQCGSCPSLCMLD